MRLALGTICFLKIKNEKVITCNVSGDRVSHRFQVKNMLKTDPNWAQQAKNLSISGA
jgi:hypothetical protein